MNDTSKATKEAAKSPRTFEIEFSGLMRLTFEDCEQWTNEDTSHYQTVLETAIGRAIFPISGKKFFEVTIDDVREGSRINA